MTLDQVRAVADAVLYEGYLLYPYRASSSKNRSRWQFGVLGPPDAAATAFAEDPGMAVQCLVEPDGGGETRVEVRLRFLQAQERLVEQRGPDAAYHSVSSLDVDGTTLLSWQEAVEREVVLDAVDLTRIGCGGSVGPQVSTVEVAAGRDEEPLVDRSGAEVGRVVRSRVALRALVTVAAEPDGGLARISVAVDNAHPEHAAGKDEAIRASFIGAHLLLRVRGGRFVSLLDPPEHAADAAQRCRQRRCFPVLAGPAGSDDVVLGSPIILYDHPEIAQESAGALFDSTEIDEILTLRVMTMTDAEKAEARATDPRAAEIIDRCDSLSTEALQQLHGVLRDPHAVGTPTDGVLEPSEIADLRDLEPPTFETGDVPWWDPAADEAVKPELDHVVIDGVRVAKGSLVRVHPSRRADAQDLFFADQVARVTAVLSDVDGGSHVALVLVDDPAADLHDWYGRYLYFAPDELEPLDRVADPAREESHP